MNQQIFCDKFLGITRANFNRALNGHSNMSANTALKASRALGTSIDVWIDPDKAAERITAWKLFKQGW